MQSENAVTLKNKFSKSLETIYALLLQKNSHLQKFRGKFGIELLGDLPADPQELLTILKNNFQQNFNTYTQELQEENLRMQFDEISEKILSEIVFLQERFSLEEQSRKFFENSFEALQNRLKFKYAIFYHSHFFNKIHKFSSPTHEWDSNLGFSQEEWSRKRKRNLLTHFGSRGRKSPSPRVPSSIIKVGFFWEKVITFFSRSMEQTEMLHINLQNYENELTSLKSEFQRQLENTQNLLERDAENIAEKYKAEVAEWENKFLEEKKK